MPHAQAAVGLVSLTPVFSCKLHGAAYGKGIYLSPISSISFGYSGKRLPAPLRPACAPTPPPAWARGRSVPCRPEEPRGNRVPRPPGHIPHPSHQHQPLPANPGLSDAPSWSLEKKNTNKSAFSRLKKINLRCRNGHFFLLPAPKAAAPPVWVPRVQLWAGSIPHGRPRGCLWHVSSPLSPRHPGELLPAGCSIPLGCPAGGE